MIRSFKITILVLALALFGLAGTAAYAQQGLAGGPDDDYTGYGNPRGKQMSEQQQEKIRKRVETIRIWRLTERLKLDPATSAKLASLLSSLDEQKKKLMREHVQSMKTLRQALKVAKPDEGMLKDGIEKIEANRRALHELKDKEISSLKDILTTEQQARYLVFQQEFHREMRGMIAKARGNEPGKGGRGQGPGAAQGQ